MRSSDRDFNRALVGALVLAAVILLVGMLRLPGVLLAVLLVVFVVMSFRRHQRTPEVESMQASLAFARDDICEVLDAYDQLLNGPTAADIADRTLHFPALANPDNTVPEVNEFLLRASSARRFVARVDGYLADPNVDRATLERLITVADQRASELEAAWDDARRAARALGPGSGSGTGSGSGSGSGA